MVSEQGAELVAEQLALYASKNHTRRWLHCTRRDIVTNLLREHASGAAGSALEIGPGSGVYLPVLAGLYDSVVAADIEAQYLSHLSPLVATTPNLTLTRDNITCTKLPSAHFDLVLCTEVIEHIANSAHALQGIYEVLKPDGILIITTPQRYSSMEMAMKIAYLPVIIDIVRSIYREPILESGHINLLTESAMRAQLAAAGFAIEYSTKSGFYLPLVAEFGGLAGLRLEQYLERKVTGTALDGVLWTQYYVAKKRP
jgi:SAM-dependent methyltransferase